MARFVVIEGADKGASFLVEGNLTIGRSEENAVQLLGHGISRVHARIAKKGARFFIKDAGSRNGVFVNDKRIVETALKDGDIVRIGSVVLAFSPAFEIHVPKKGAPRARSTTKETSASEMRVAHQGEPPGPASADAVFILPGRSSTLTPILESSATDLGDVSKEVDKAESPRELAIALRRLKAVYDVGTAIASILDEESLLNRLLELLLQVFGAERGAIILCSETGTELRVGAVRWREKETGNVHISRTVLNQALLDGKAVISSDVRHDPRFEGSKSIRIDDVKSILCAPLKSREKLMGAVYLDTKEFLRSFDEEDLSLLMNIARQAGVAIDNARLYTRTREEATRLRKHLEEEFSVIGDSPEMLSLLAKVRKVAASGSTVLLIGETGTGKELLARMIHHESARRAKPFVPVDSTAISETLLESELFGHERGAFTGADRLKPGKFEIANGGTIFLDEIGDMSMSAQAKLLRVLEERAFTRVGGVRIIDVDVRVIAATNTNLQTLVEKGKFREDLYFRLAVVPLTIPPLRQRRNDIRLLANHFLKRFAAASGKNISGFTRSAMEALSDYDWPGNARELRNVIEGIVVLGDKPVVDFHDLPYPMCTDADRQLYRAAVVATPAQGGDSRIEPRQPASAGSPEHVERPPSAMADRTTSADATSSGETPGTTWKAAGEGAGETAADKREFANVPEALARQFGEVPLAELVSQVERTYVQRALQQANGKKVEAARILGISRPTLDKKIKEFGIDVGA